MFKKQHRAPISAVYGGSTCSRTFEQLYRAPYHYVPNRFDGRGRALVAGAALGVAHERAEHQRRMQTAFFVLLIALAVYLLLKK